MIDVRIAERRAAVQTARRRRRVRRLIGLLAVAVVVAAGVAIERSSLVALQEVEVTGTDRLTAEEVLAAAELAPGRSILRLDLAQVEERVERLPLVRDASVQRVDRLRVRIEVVERVPMIVATGRGATRQVDRDGVIIAEGEFDGLPVVALRDAPPEVGGEVADVPALANAHRAWRGLTGPLRTQVERLEAPGPDQLTLELVSGVEVRFGRAERVDEKVRALGVILEDLGDLPVESIDVRAPSAPVIVSG
jgi:cell division protein FtsQ